MMLGDSNVGKTCILNKFIENSFTLNLMSTLGVEQRHKDLDVDGIKYSLHIWDTAG